MITMEGLIDICRREDYPYHNGNGISQAICEYIKKHTHDPYVPNHMWYTENNGFEAMQLPESAIEVSELDVYGIFARLDENSIVPWMILTRDKAFMFVIDNKPEYTVTIVISGNIAEIQSSSINEFDPRYVSDVEEG